jgi:hypothetical protein
VHKNKIPIFDADARAKIAEYIGEDIIPNVKSLAKNERDEILKRVKMIEGITQRQAARILGISSSLIFKA